MGGKTLIFVLGTVFFNALSQLLIKSGSTGEVFQLSLKGGIAILTNWKILLGLFVQLFAVYFWLKVLSVLNLSVAFPLMISLLVLSLMVSSVIFLGEQVSVKHCFGTCFILVGVACIMMK